MKKIKIFTKLLEKIDKVLESYDPGELEPDKVIKEIIIYRANQRPILEKAIKLASKGLKKYPYNSQLLSRRAYARCRVVTTEGVFTELEKAEKDLRMILVFDPYNLQAALELLEDMFKFSGMEDKDIAEVTGNLVINAENLLLKFIALQIKSLAYDGDFTKAKDLYNHWILMFPNSEYLLCVKEDIDSIKPSLE